MAKKILLPFAGANCCICGRYIQGKEYEAVKPKGKYPAMYFHTACVEKERAKR